MRARFENRRFTPTFDVTNERIGAVWQRRINYFLHSQNSGKEEEKKESPEQREREGVSE